MANLIFAILCIFYALHIISSSSIFLFFWYLIWVFLYTYFWEYIADPFFYIWAYFRSLVAIEKLDQYNYRVFYIVFLEL